MKKRPINRFSLFVICAIFLPLLAACTGEETAETAEPTAIAIATVAELEPTAIPPTETMIPPTATAIPVETPATEADTAVTETEPTATAIPTETPLPEPTATVDPAAAAIGAFSGSSQTNGETLILFGQVLDVNGQPVSGAEVEIWQTDFSGVYDHPGDRGTSGRDQTFQFFGSATAGPDGWYAFRTIVPGRYEPRPRHIHFKVKQNGNTLLTSQFYFSDDIAEVSGEGIFRQAGDNGDLLLLQLAQGDSSLLANGQIVVDLGLGSGSLPLTPSQTEGPYYPVVPVAEYDNDLVVLP